MKNLLFGLMAIVLFTNMSFGQVSYSLIEVQDGGDPIIENTIEREIKILAVKLYDYEYQKSQIPKSGMNSNNNITIQNLNSSITKTKELLIPKCVNYLKTKFNFNDNDVIECFGSLNNNSIISGVSILIGIKQFNPNILNPLEFSELSNEITNRVGPTVMGCLLEAVGVTAIMEILENGIEKMGKSAVKKLLKKVASKYLGFVGGALAIYDFGECMDWW